MLYSEICGPLSYDYLGRRYYNAFFDRKIEMIIPGLITYCAKDLELNYMYSNFVGLVNIFAFLLELCGSSNVIFLQKIKTLLFSQGL